MVNSARLVQRASRSSSGKRGEEKALSPVFVILCPSRMGHAGPAQKRCFIYFRLEEQARRIICCGCGCIDSTSVLCLCEIDCSDTLSLNFQRRFGVTFSLSLTNSVAESRSMHRKVSDCAVPRDELAPMGWVSTSTCLLSQNYPAGRIPDD